VKPIGIHHVNLMFEDIDAAREFYGETLGFEELERPDFGFPGLWFQMGAHQIHLQPGGAPDSFQHFALEVEGFDSLVEELRELGVEIMMGAPVDGAGRQAFIKDPTGNIIELNQPG
jgi:catechol 2,3-dioxygenase-like lactoylglutathione lyase family enzyme